MKLHRAFCLPAFPTAALVLSFSPGDLFGDVNDPPAPTIHIWVDGRQVRSPEILESISEEGETIYTLENYSANNSRFRISLDAVMNPDPTIGYVLSVVDLGAPSSFVFSFSVATIPTGAPNFVRASIVGGLTDFTGDGVSLTPTAGAVQISSVSPPLTGMGVDVGPAAAFGPGAPGALYNYGSFSTGFIPGPGPGPWTMLQADVAFTLSGGGDLAALTGFAEIVESTTRSVPESSTAGSIAMLGAAAGVWYNQRRRLTRR